MKAEVILWQIIPKEDLHNLLNPRFSFSISRISWKTDIDFNEMHMKWQIYHVSELLLCSVLDVDVLTAQFSLLKTVWIQTEMVNLGLWWLLGNQAKAKIRNNPRSSGQSQKVEALRSAHDSFTLGLKIKQGHLWLLSFFSLASIYPSTSESPNWLSSDFIFY